MNLPEAPFTPATTPTAEFPGGFAVLMSFYFYNDPHLFEIAVDSIFSNTLQPAQVVLVADGPLSDGLEQTLLKLRQRYGNRIDLLRLPTNVGHALALNAGLRHITLPWVVRADVDDFNLPHRFSTLAALLASQPGLELMGSAILEVDATGRAIAVRDVPTTEEGIRKFAKIRTPFNHMAVAYRRDAVLACGGYPDVHLKEDYALWCHMLARRSKVANTSEILVHATAGRDMYRRRGGWRYAKAEWELQNVMVSCGLKTWGKAWFDGLLRASVFLAPAGLRGKVYENFLRKTTNRI
ncbi:MAG TPA: glycosyltransferase [Gallionellaceae bacterium]